MAAIADLDPAPTIALTTNGIGLAERAAGLAAAGLKRINISLDTLDPETFKRITRRPRLADVLAGVEASVAAGLLPVKINTVLLRGVNDHEAYPLLEWAMRTGVQLRFIEQMPLDAQHAWKRTEMITADEIRERLSAHVTLVEDDRDGPAGERAGRAVPGRGHRARGRHHRVGQQAVLWRLRPGPADRRRSAAQLPVRPDRVRSARPAACRSLRRGARGSVGARRGDEASRPRHRRPVVPAARPADVGHRRLSASSRRAGQVLDLAQEAAGRQERGDSDSRCSVHASQCLRRSGVWIFGLFHCRSYAAAVRQSLAEQTRPSGPLGSGSMPRSSGCGSGDPVIGLLVVDDLAADDLATLLAGGDGGCVARVTAADGIAGRSLVRLVGEDHGDVGQEHRAGEQDPAEGARARRSWR